MPSPDAPVTILGAGIVGICTALSLLDRGVAVRLVDRDAPGQGASMGNAGVVSPWSVVPQSMPGTWRSVPALMARNGRPLAVHPRAWPRMVPWGLRFLRAGRPGRVAAVSDAMAVLCAPSIDLYRRHLDGTGHGGLIRDACYVHAFRDGRKATLDGLDARLRLERGAAMEVVGRDRLAEVEPALGPAFAAAIVIAGQARVLSPGRLGRVLADKARGLGATILRARVTGIGRDGDGWAIRTGDGVLTAPSVVVAMGAWSGDLLAGIGRRVPLMAERGYHVAFARPGIEIRHSVMDVDAKVVASSMEDGVRVAGQAEFAPLDAPADPGREARLTRIARAAFPALDTSRRRAWMGRRPSLPDGLPMLGPVPGAPGLFAAFGHSHHGLMMAPASGEVVAGLVTGARPNNDLSPYAVDRFG